MNLTLGKQIKNIKYIYIWKQNILIMLHSSILLRLQAAIITLSPSILVDELFWLSLELRHSAEHFCLQPRKLHKCFLT